MLAIIEYYPEFALQNRRDLIQKKVKLIRQYSPNRSDVYIKNLLKRHPDMFMRSYASFEAKVNYFRRNLNRQLANEKAFPLLLHYSYSDVIWPRCEIMVEQGNENFNVAEVLRLTDRQFCQKFQVGYQELKQKKAKRKQVEEKDSLWAYVPGL